MSHEDERIEELEIALDSTRDMLLAAEQRATDAEATLATIGGADKATLARKLRRANAAMRDAEQRAKESEARAERLREALDETLDAYLHTVRYHERDTEWPRASDLSGGAEIVRTARVALTNPATQPDERAAEAHHARIAHVGEAVAAQCAAKEGTRLSVDS